MKFKNVFFRAVSILITLIFVFVVAMFLSGAKGFAVLSNSMSPTFNRGDVVFVKKIIFSELQTNDIVTVAFKNNEGTFTHRVVEIDNDKKLVYTKGDNSSVVDSAPSEAERIVGKLWFSLPLLGYLSIVLANRYALISLVGIVILLIITSKIILSIKQKKG